MRAFMIEQHGDELTLGVREHQPRPTDDRDVLVAVEYSGVNFKDSLVARAKSRVRRRDSLVGGVDAAGVVIASGSAEMPVGTRVAVHGGDIGVGRDGGFAEELFAPASACAPLPDTISTRDAMVIGTAGFTAMASVLALEHHGLAPGAEVLVTGATGGVGSQAVAYLARRGYRPFASTGSIDQAAWLQELGAAAIVARDAIADKPDRVLASERWDGAIDCIGGATLAQILRSLRYGAAVAASGLVAGAELQSTVYPFITRAVALLGIDAVEAPAAVRSRVWRALGEVAPDVPYDLLIDSVVSLESVPGALDAIANGKTRGRILVVPTPG